MFERLEFICTRLRFETEAGDRPGIASGSNLDEFKRAVSAGCHRFPCLAERDSRALDGIGSVSHRTGQPCGLILLDSDIRDIQGRQCGGPLSVESEIIDSRFLDFREIDICLVKIQEICGELLEYSGLSLGSSLLAEGHSVMSRIIGIHASGIIDNLVCFPSLKTHRRSNQHIIHSALICSTHKHGAASVQSVAPFPCGIVAIVVDDRPHQQLLGILEITGVR